MGQGLGPAYTGQTKFWGEAVPTQCLLSKGQVLAPAWPLPWVGEPGKGLGTAS